MKIKSNGAFVLAMSVAVFGQAAFAQNPVQQAAPASAVATPGTPAPQSTAPNSATPPGEVKGNFEFDALGFKGSFKFDGNPLSVMQQPAAPAQQSMQQMPMQQMPMQQMPMQQMPMQQMPMQQMPMQQMQMQQMPMQQMPMQTMMPMQQMPMQQMPMQQMPMQQMPMQQMPMAQTPAAPAAPMIDLSGIQKAASAIAPKVINALPALGLPAAPAFIDESSKMIQSIFPGNKQATPVNAMNPMQSMNAMQPMAQSMSMTMNSGAMPEANAEVLTALDQFSKAVKYNLEMAQEAAYLAGFGDPTMRATSALEAQKNATEARATADRAFGMAGNYGGEAAQILASIRASAGQAQSLADQARAASNNSNGLAP